MAELLAGVATRLLLGPLLDPSDWTTDDSIEDDDVSLQLRVVHIDPDGVVTVTPLTPATYGWRNEGGGWYTVELTAGLILAGQLQVGAIHPDIVPATSPVYTVRAAALSTFNAGVTPVELAAGTITAGKYDQSTAFPVGGSFTPSSTALKVSGFETAALNQVAGAMVDRAVAAPIANSVAVRARATAAVDVASIAGDAAAASALALLYGAGVTLGAVTGAASASGWRSDIDAPDGFHDDAGIVFLTGTQAGQARFVASQLNALGVITPDAPLTAAPEIGDQFALIGRRE
jgi:hypothetical protein